ncbi:MAG: hypothetical protein D4R64_09080 [Porphyromonadaceae bacterium]|nr:MAG: hypothetical protein D4R64_09080 [Porphyromonadaceae bacterium]
MQIPVQKGEIRRIILIHQHCFGFTDIYRPARTLRGNACVRPNLNLPLRNPELLIRIYALSLEPSIRSSPAGLCKVDGVASRIRRFAPPPAVTQGSALAGPWLLIRGIAMGHETGVEI